MTEKPKGKRAEEAPATPPKPSAGGSYTVTEKGALKLNERTKEKDAK